MCIDVFRWIQTTKKEMTSEFYGLLFSNANILVFYLNILQRLSVGICHLFSQSLGYMVWRHQHIFYVSFLFSFLVSKRRCAVHVTILNFSRWAKTKQSEKKKLKLTKRRPPLHRLVANQFYVIAKNYSCWLCAFSWANLSNIQSDEL